MNEPNPLLYTQPSSAVELLVPPESFQVDSLPDLEAVELQATNGAEAVALEVIAQSGLMLTSRQVERSIADDTTSPAINPERIQIVTDAAERRKLASAAIQLSSAIYRADYVSVTQHPTKSREIESVDIDKVSDLYDITEHYDQLTPLTLLARLRESSTKIDQNTLIKAERFIRIILSGAVDEIVPGLNEIRAAKQKSEQLARSA